MAIVGTGTKLIVRHDVELMKPPNQMLVLICESNGTDMLIVYTLVANNIKIVQKWLPDYFISTIKFQRGRAVLFEGFTRHEKVRAGLTFYFSAL